MFVMHSPFPHFTAIAIVCSYVLIVQLQLSTTTPMFNAERHYSKLFLHVFCCHGTFVKTTQHGVQCPHSCFPYWELWLSHFLHTLIIHSHCFSRILMHIIFLLPILYWSHIFNAHCLLVPRTSKCCSASFSSFLLSWCSHPSVIMILLYFTPWKQQSIDCYYS